MSSRLFTDSGLHSSVASGPSKRDEVERLALQLVREYLTRKGYSGTLDKLHSELPTPPQPTTRKAISNDLGLIDLLKANKKRGKSSRGFPFYISRAHLSVSTAMK